MTTPLARLGTFLFPSQGRRVSAPAPHSPHEPSKRRSAIATCDSPPRCRRRLSFADVDVDVVVVERACSPPPDVTPALRHRACAIRDAELRDRPRLWAEIAAIARRPASHDGMHEPALRRAFENAFREGAAAAEVLAAVDALGAVCDDAPVPMGSADVPVVQGVMNAVATHAADPALVEAVAGIVGQNDWGRVFSVALSDVSSHVVHALLKSLQTPEMEAKTWEAILHLLAMCAEACLRAARLEADADRPLTLQEEDAAVVLASFERLADRNDASTESALRALRVLVGDRRVARAFLKADASAVLSEVSSVHAGRLAVQHACIDVLVALSMPRVLQQGI